jgi:hypothetical protein
LNFYIESFDFLVAFSSFLQEGRRRGLHHKKKKKWVTLCRHQTSGMGHGKGKRGAMTLMELEKI